MGEHQTCPLVWYWRTTNHLRLFDQCAQRKAPKCREQSNQYDILNVSRGSIKHGSRPAATIKCRVVCVVKSGIFFQGTKRPSLI
jgi:hypothetical protein